jgi:hypothetical protein
MKDRGFKPGVDYDFFPAPGLSGASIIQADTIVAMAGAQEKLAKNFLRSVASADGQVAFNRLKGSVAASVTAPADFYDAIGAKEHAALTKPGAVVLPNLRYLVPTGLDADIGSQIERFAANPTDAVLDSAIAALEARRTELKTKGAFIAW